MPPLLTSRIEDYFIERIRSRAIRPGERLPTVREIQEQFEVGYVTAANAIRNLCAMGYITSHRGRGSFARLPEHAPEDATTLRIAYLLAEASDQAAESYHMHVFRGAAAYCRLRGHDLRFFCADREHTADMLSEVKGLSAIIVNRQSAHDQYGLARFADAGVPVICCNSTRACGLGSVHLDNFHGAILATRHLLAHGHKRILFVNAMDTTINYRIEDRYQGFCRALRDAGLEPTEPVSWHIDIDTRQVTRILEQVKRGRGNPPTALFAANDAMAVEIIRTAGILGISIPQKLSIMGFEDLPVGSRLKPAVTTMTFNKYEFGRQAVRLAEELVANPKIGPMAVALPMTLLERESVTRANRRKT